MPSSLTVLKDSVDRCMDDESVEIRDWDLYLKTYLLSSRMLNLYIKLSQIPCLGKYFQMLIYRDLAMTYDVIVNFKEAHEAADSLVQDLIKKSHSREILEESKRQVQGCNLVLS